MKLTPRQIAAYLFLAERRRERDLAQLLSVISLGSSDGEGAAEAINKQIATWADQ